MQIWSSEYRPVSSGRTCVCIYATTHCRFTSRLEHVRLMDPGYKHRLQLLAAVLCLTGMLDLTDSCSRPAVCFCISILISTSVQHRMKKRSIKQRGGACVTWNSLFTTQTFVALRLRLIETTYIHSHRISPKPKQILIRQQKSLNLCLFCCMSCCLDSLTFTLTGSLGLQEESAASA